MRSGLSTSSNWNRNERSSEPFFTPEVRVGEGSAVSADAPSSGQVWKVVSWDLRVYQMTALGQRPPQGLGLWVRGCRMLGLGSAVWTSAGKTLGEVGRLVLVVFLQ